MTRPPGGGGYLPYRSLHGVDILTHFGFDPAGLGTLRQGLPAAQAGVILGSLGQLDILMLQVGADGAGFKLRHIERVHGGMRVVHRLLCAHHVALNLLRALVDANCLVSPIRKDVVARHPHQFLVTGHGGEMTRHLGENDERGAGRLIAHGEQLRIYRGNRIRHIYMVAVHRVQVRRVVHLVEVLPVARLLFVCLGDGLSRGHEPLHAGDKDRVIVGDFAQNAKAETGHGV